MGTADARAWESFRARIAEEYAQRFPASREHFARASNLLDGCSHAVRWNDPFMPVVRRAEGAILEDLDGNRFIDYWQGHFANLLGHNPPLIRDALAAALAEGRGLQSGMLHEIEARLAERICACTATEVVRLTTSGSLGTFYAMLLARGFTGRERVLKVKGGWHGAQPFGLLGVSAHGGGYDRIESEGLSRSASGEILLTRYNDIDDLRGMFERNGDQIACMVVEPVLGQGGGIAARTDYLREARRLTERHGALLICDEIITGFRFRAGDASSLFGVQPDLLVLGKVLGGGMPVAAVAGRRDVLALCSREVGRVKFEGGTYSAHELALIAALTLLEHLVANEEVVYATLAAKRERLNSGLKAVARRHGVPFWTTGALEGRAGAGSILMVHFMDADEEGEPANPEEVAARAHPYLGDRLLKSLLLLHGVSVRTGLGAISSAHQEADLERTVAAYGEVLDRLRRAGLV